LSAQPETVFWRSFQLFALLLEKRLIAFHAKQSENQKTGRQICRPHPMLLTKLSVQSFGNVFEEVSEL